MVLMNALHWGGEGCQDCSCLLLSVPKRPVSACSVRRCWQECVFPWQKCNLLHTHNSSQCPLSSSWKWVQCCFPAQHPSLPSREHSARGPAPSPRHSGQAGAGLPQLQPDLLWPLVPEGAAEAQLTCKHSKSSSISLYPGQWLLVSVSLQCRDI